MPRDVLNRIVLRKGFLAALRDVIEPGGRVELPRPGPPPGNVAMTQGPGWISFQWNGVTAWRIDEKLFAGSPALTARAMPQGGLAIELNGARFPGTPLPADFVCVLGPKGILGTLTDLRFTLGEFHGQVTLERWLAGSQPLHSLVKLGAEVCPLGTGSKLLIQGQAEARFAPRWDFTMGGRSSPPSRGSGPTSSATRSSFACSPVWIRASARSRSRAARCSASPPARTAGR